MAVGRWAPIALALLLAGACTAYKPPKTGATATMKFVLFDNSGNLGLGQLMANYYPTGKRSLMAQPLIAVVKPANNLAADEALKEAHKIPATGEDFVFSLTYQAVVGLTIYTCALEVRFRPEPDAEYLTSFNTTADQRCGANLLRVTPQGPVVEPSARAAFGDMKKG